MNHHGQFRDTACDNTYEIDDNINRYVINTNVDVNVNQNFNVALGIFARIRDGNQSGGGTTAILNSLITTPRNAYPVFNPDGSLAGSTSWRHNLYGQVGNTGYQLDYSRDLVANIQMK